MFTQLLLLQALYSVAEQRSPLSCHLSVKYWLQFGNQMIVQFLFMSEK